MRQVHVKISGHVQGVFFRANTQREATKLGLTGWVKNTEDGGVEAMAQGNEDELNLFIAWCHKGPTSANVTNVEVMWVEQKKSFSGFDIKY